MNESVLKTIKKVKTLINKVEKPVVKVKKKVSSFVKFVKKNDKWL